MMSYSSAPRSVLLADVQDRHSRVRVVVDHGAQALRYRSRYFFIFKTIGRHVGRSRPSVAASPPPAVATCREERPASNQDFSTTRTSSSVFLALK